MAQLANMSTEAFEEFFFKVCTLDYRSMAAAMEPLRERMARTDRVHLKGPARICASTSGTSASCPARGGATFRTVSVSPRRCATRSNGTIRYNTPSLYLGTTYTNVRFTFEGGRIVRANGEPQDSSTSCSTRDEGARYVGEFSLGFNPYILHPMKDTLFDEKIAGSLHFTPGQCYEQADNGNRSRVHWDLVLIQRPEYGGGEIWFDDECVRRDGRFVVPELEGLNPERLQD